MNKDLRNYFSEFGTYIVGDSKELNSKVSITNYRIFSAIEHIAGYGNLVLSNFYPELRNSTGVEDLVTIDVFYRDVRSILGYLGHIKSKRQPGVVGTVRDIRNMAKKAKEYGLNNLTKDIRKAVSKSLKEDS